MQSDILLVMKMLKFLIPASLLSLVINIVILLAVTQNYDWVKTRAAGGQFDDFPTAIRVIYFFMAILMVVLVYWLWDNRKSSLSQSKSRLARIIGIVFVLSTITQLISQSADERWNAIPAAILAVTFLKLAKQK
jgi:hypothetical protein